MNAAMKATRFVGKSLAGFSVIALLVMMFITIADIFLRFFFNSPITGAIEISRMMNICMSATFVLALVERRHIGVGMFVDKLGRKAQLAFDAFGYLLSAALCGITSYQAVMEALKKMTRREVYTMLKMSTWPFYLLFSAAMGLFAIAIVICLIDACLDKDRYTAQGGC